MKGREQERLLDFSVIFESAQIYLNFDMWALFYLRNIPLIEVVSLDFLRFRE